MDSQFWEYDDLPSVSEPVNISVLHYITLGLPAKCKLACTGQKYLLNCLLFHIGIIGVINILCLSEGYVYCHFKWYKSFLDTFFKTCFMA